MTNVTPDLTKGGSFAMAHVGGDTSAQLQGSPDKLYRQIASLPYSISDATDAKKGSYYAWAPEKPQDLLLNQPVQVDPYSGNPMNKPFSVAVYTAPPDSPQKYELTWKMMVEYMSNDINNYYVASLCSPTMHDMVLSELAKGPVMECNPSHLSAVAKRVREIISDPLVRNVAKVAGEAAFTIGSMLLL